MKEPNLYAYNVYQSRKQEEQMILLMSVFSYGFIVLISVISIANILIRSQRASPFESGNLRC